MISHQLAAARDFAEARLTEEGPVVLVACRKGAGGLAHADEVDGAPVFPVSCGGNEAPVSAPALGVCEASAPGLVLSKFRLCLGPARPARGSRRGEPNQDGAAVWPSVTGAELRIRLLSGF